MEQPRKWRTLKRHPLSANYPDIKGHAWKRFVEVLTANGIAGRRRIVIHERMVIDGWQLYRACLEADLKPEFGPLPKGWTAEEYVEMAQELRRHESQEAMAAHAEARRQRVAAARQEGQSIRQIAATEGISKSTVERDIAETGATVPGGTVDGKDGRQRPASKPKPLCTRCQHSQDIGRPYDSGKCAACQELRKPKPATDPMTSPQRGTRQAAKVAALIEPPAREPGDDSEEIAAEANLPKDQEGHLLPESLQPAFSSLPVFCSLDGLARQMQATMDTLSRSPGGEQLRPFLQPTGPAEKTINKSEELNILKRHFRFTRPHAVCPYCVGKGKKDCPGCKGTGWVTETTWRDAEPNVKARLQ